MTYILVDTANTFFRARHIVKDNNPDTKIGLAMHIILNSIKKAWTDFNGSHVVFCLEGRSWRKDYYAKYKANRDLARSALTEREVEGEKVFWESYETFCNFINDKTNCTVLQDKQLEADDLIAGWVKEHPNDDHVIISSDSDFAQLITPNVKQYNGIANVLTTHEGYYTDTNEPIIDKKTGEPKKAPNPQWLLFEKCMRGDPTDNVFSAFPKVRKTKLLEAFEDRNAQGFIWNNVMLSKWVDHEGIEHRVKDDYERNRELIDLSRQPDLIKQIINSTIKSATSNPKNSQQVGVYLMRFCHLFDLQKIKDLAGQYAAPLNGRYGT
jgi:hypothetical protein